MLISRLLISVNVIAILASCGKSRDASVNEPNPFTQLSEIKMPEEFGKISSHNGTVIVSSSGQVKVIKVQDPSNPRIVANLKPETFESNETAFLSSDEQSLIIFNKFSPAINVFELNDTTVSPVQSFYTGVKGVSTERVADSEALTLREDRSNKTLISARIGDIVYLVGADKSLGTDYLYSVNLSQAPLLSAEALKLDGYANGINSLAISSDQKKLYAIGDASFVSLDLAQPSKPQLIRIQEPYCALGKTIRNFKVVDEKYLVLVTDFQILACDLQDLSKDPVMAFSFDKNPDSYWREKLVAFAGDKLLISTKFRDSVEAWSLKDLKNPLYLGRTRLASDRASGATISGIAVLSSSVVSILDSYGPMIVLGIAD